MMIMELLLELASTIALTLLLLHFVAKLVSSSPETRDSELAVGKIGLVRGCDFLVQSGIADSGIGNRVTIEDEEEEPVSQAIEDDGNRRAVEKIVERVEFSEKGREFVDESLGVSEDLGRLLEKLVEQEISAEHVEEEAPVSRPREEDENRSSDKKIFERYELQQKFLEICVETVGVSVDLGRVMEKLSDQEILAFNVAEKAVMASQALEEDEKRCVDENIVLLEKFREISDEFLGVSEDLERLMKNLVEQEIFADYVREEEAPISQALEEGENICTDEKIVEDVENVREFVDESLDVSENSVRLGDKLVEQEISCENGGSFERKLGLFDESPERDNAGEIEECLDDDEDGDWVGIERTELEKLFGSAMAFVESASNKARISVLENGVKTRLYGLQMIATQGPCLEPQPLALKFSSRAKWNAWQQLGDMTPETAMEQYVSLLSGSVPGWMHSELKAYEKQVSVEAGDVRKLEQETHH